MYIKGTPSRTMTATATIQQIIRTDYNGYTLSGWVIDRIAAEAGFVARSTVYAAIRKLIQAGEVDANRVYTGRQHISPTEITEALGTGPHVFNDALWQKLSDQFHAEQRVVYYAVEAALSAGYMSQPSSGHTYGWLLYVNPARAA